MKRIPPYHLLLLLLVLVITACGGKKRLNTRYSLWRNDKIPYGTWYAYNELNHIFPGVEVVNNKLSPDRYKGYTNGKAKVYEEAAKYDNKKLLYIIITGDVEPDESEVTSIMNMLGEGKHIFISAIHISSNLLDSLRLETGLNRSVYKFNDSLSVSVNNPVTYDSTSYTYPGMAMDNYFSKMDSSITTILGRDQSGHANFVRFSYESGGSMYVHLAPSAFTNYFLLHKNNKTYYDKALSYLPKDLEVVKWDDYFRYHSGGDEKGNSGGGFNSLDWILKQPYLSTALWLLAGLFMLIFLFESKRKQRPIPVVAPVSNSSLDFVKTIGRLYFQRKDNKNLAYKMTAHFLDHVRGKYNIRTSFSDPEFEKRLAWKTGNDPESVRELLYFIKYVQDQPNVGDITLMELNHKLDHFYKLNT